MFLGFASRELSGVVKSQICDIRGNRSIEETEIIGGENNTLYHLEQCSNGWCVAIIYSFHLLAMQGYLRNRACYWYILAIVAEQDFHCLKMVLIARKPKLSLRIACGCRSNYGAFVYFAVDIPTITRYGCSHSLPNCLSPLSPLSASSRHLLVSSSSSPQVYRRSARSSH